MDAYRSASRIRVLDASVDLAGRYAGRVLARHGFDVTRVAIVHPRARPTMVFDGPATGRDAPFARYLDSGTPQAEVDLTSPGGTGDLDRLLRTHDVVLSTFDADTATALGLDAGAVRETSPSTSVVSITPHGLTSPPVVGALTDEMLFAESGAMLVSGPPDRPPLGPHLPIASVLGGAFAAMSVVLLALEAPTRAREVDISLLDVLAANTERVLSYYTYLESVPHRGVGSGRIEQSAGAGAFRAKDGFFYVFSGYQWFDRVMEMVGLPPVKDKVGAASGTSRRERKADIDRAVSDAIRELPLAVLAERAQRLRMPSGPVNTIADLLRDEQLAVRGAFPRLDHRTVDIEEPFRIVDGPGGERQPAARDGAASGGGPLAGVRVLDLSHAYAGPTTSRLLAEMGADVVKIESVKRLDLLARGMLPFDNDTGPGWWDRSGYFAERNLGKRAMTLDMAEARGRELFLELIRTADVLVTNFTPRVLRGWGLGSDVMHEVNPRLVILLMTGFGQHGPKSENPALAGTMEAASGFSAMVRHSDDDLPGSLGFNFGDMTSGIYGTLAVLLGLHRRTTRGTGQVIDFACAEAPISFLAAHVLEWERTAAEPSCTDDLYHQGSHVLVRAGDDGERHRWVLVYLPGARSGEREDLARCIGADASVPGTGEATALHSAHTRSELEALLTAGGFSWSPLADAEDLWFDPGLRRRQFFLFGRRLSMPVLPYARAFPVLVDGQPVAPAMATIPGLGSDTWSLLGTELLMAPSEFAVLEDQALLGTRPHGRLPGTFEVPLALDDLEAKGLLRRVAGARARLLASFHQPG